MMEFLSQFARNRLLERSTWRGFILLLTGLGISVDPAHLEALAAMAATLIGALEMLQPDHAGRMDGALIIEEHHIRLDDEIDA